MKINRDGAGAFASANHRHGPWARVFSDSEAAGQELYGPRSRPLVIMDDDLRPRLSQLNGAGGIAQAQIHRFICLNCSVVENSEREGAGQLRFRGTERSGVW